MPNISIKKKTNSTSLISRLRDPSSIAATPLETKSVLFRSFDNQKFQKDIHKRSIYNALPTTLL